ncbi:hypothetical protein V502_05436 [Pseudogymnoascus sp. VKM F-4520 (FW-2644)]|nr:hypothetical protein V502_05436 [Pseudogymnoascus sp. VKM F-4520 (FW-2644)]
MKHQRVNLLPQAYRAENPHAQNGKWGCTVEGHNELGLACTGPKRATNIGESSNIRFLSLPTKAASQPWDNRDEKLWPFPTPAPLGPASLTCALRQLRLDEHAHLPPGAGEPHGLCQLNRPREGHLDHALLRHQDQADAESNAKDFMRVGETKLCDIQCKDTTLGGPRNQIEAGGRDDESRDDESEEDEPEEEDSEEQGFTTIEWEKMGEREQHPS